MKNKFLYLFIMLIVTGCHKEFFIEDRLDDAIPFNNYSIGDNIKYSININNNRIDTIPLLIERNDIETNRGNDPVFGYSYCYEEFSFIATTPFLKYRIEFNYNSLDSIIHSVIDLDNIYFGIAGKEEKVESMEIDGTAYQNIYMAYDSYFNAYAYFSANLGIIKIIADSISLSPIN